MLCISSIFVRDVLQYWGVSQSESVDKLKKNGFLYGIPIISIGSSKFKMGGREGKCKPQI